MSIHLDLASRGQIAGGHSVLVADISPKNANFMGFLLQNS